HAADGGDDLERRQHISCDLDGSAKIFVGVLERQRGERANVIHGNKPHWYIRLDRDGERATRCATRHIGTRSDKGFHEKAWTQNRCWQAEGVNILLNLPLVGIAADMGQLLRALN